MIAAFFVLAPGCGGGAAKQSPTRIVLNTERPRPTIDIVDVPEDLLRTLRGVDSREAWSAIVKVSAGTDQPAMIGQHEVIAGGIRFTPMFPLDRGRPYLVKFTAPGAQPVTATLSLPAPDRTPTTRVTQVFPSGDLIPENQLRVHIQFSAPMGSRGGLDYVHLLDEDGNELEGPFMPLDPEFFNTDRTRYTVFFNPGRLNRAPGDPTGRFLTNGRSYTFVINSAWLDGNGLPLKEPFRRTFTVGPPDTQPLDPRTWKITAPTAGTAGPLVVIFPEPLDQGSLQRALGVLSPDGEALDGQMAIGAGEQTWSFAPSSAWQPGQHNLFALAMLEDLAGNRVGRAFEVESFDRAEEPAATERTLLPFVVR